uniref:Microtubule associated protein futsch n=1 Tax=Rhipicephalus zambeziensis TaxID=60191 RepID=A0A224YVF8_9ACAR
MAERFSRFHEVRDYQGKGVDVYDDNLIELEQSSLAEPITQHASGAGHEVGGRHCCLCWWPLPRRAGLLAGGACPCWFYLAPPSFLSSCGVAPPRTILATSCSCDMDGNLDRAWARMSK